MIERTLRSFHEFFRSIHVSIIYSFSRSFLISLFFRSFIRVPGGVGGGKWLFIELFKLFFDQIKTVFNLL